MTEDLEQRIRQRAHAIWGHEGHPEGRAEAHWDLAREEIAIEDNYRGTLKPNPSHGPDDIALHSEPVEPALAMENLGEQPGLADQGEGFHVPGDTGQDPWPEPEAEPAGATAPPPVRSRRPRRGG